MKHCHVCKTECEDSAELCPLCGADLSREVEETEKAESEKTEINDPVLLATFEDIVSSEIFRDILTENGILYSCDGEDAMRVTFGGGFVSQDIFVDASDLAQAEQLYNEFLDSEVSFDGEFDEEFFEEEE
ncbi:MAG: hypothetical protein IKB45_01845 [Clostridia bacterium]|nr:hypothetical protein [Clostridia bacterium]